MGQWGKARDCLTKKNEILEKIAANTETQYRFIRKREMRGLRRVLREREALIKELLSINLALSQEKGWETKQELISIIQVLKDKQQEILARSRQVIEEAIAERNYIGMELKSSRVRQQVKNQYMNPWAAVTPGRRFNEKG